MTTDIIHNKEKLRFEIDLGDDIARLEYRYYKDNMALMHTVVPEKYSGQGLATKLAEHVFAYARSNKIQLIVYCPFVAAYLKRHPEQRDLLNKEFTGPEKFN